MIRFVSLLVLLVPMVAWGQPVAPPLEVYDGTNACQPAYAIQFGAGSVSCGQTVDGRPLATINVGATPGTVPWQNVTAGSNSNNLDMAGGILSPGTAGTIEANRLVSGNVNLTVPTHVGMTAGHMYVGDTAAGSQKIVQIAQCDAATEKIRWNSTTLAWECVPDSGGGTSNWADLVPGDNNTSGQFTFSGPALFQVSSQLRIPASTLVPSVGEELKIDTDGDGTAITTPQLTFRYGGIVYKMGGPSTDPTADGDVLTFNQGQNRLVWAQPPGAGTGAPPGGAVGSVQFKETATVFGGSSRWQVDPVTGELVGACDSGTLGDCADTMVAENATVAAPTGTNEARVYPKRTGNIYDLCWNGQGDAGERCATTSGVHIRAQTWEMAGKNTDGTAVMSQWDYESGTVTPNSETAGVMRYASLSFAASGTTCVQRRFRFATTDDVQTGNLDARLYWKTDATAGSVTFTMQAACWNTGINETAVGWIGSPIAPGPDSVNGAGLRNFIDFPDIDISPCSQSATVALRLCQTANALSGGSENLARTTIFQYEVVQQMISSTSE